MPEAPASPAAPVSPAHAWPEALLLSAVFLLTAGWKVHLQPIENPDEPRYACPARSMLRGETDWLVPRFNDAERVRKPILIYWALALAGKAGQAVGLELPAAFRLVPLLAGLLSVLCAYGLARRLISDRAGLLAGLVLVGTYYFHMQSRAILIDPVLTGLLAFAWYCFAVALERLGAAGTDPSPYPLPCGARGNNGRSLPAADAAQPLRAPVLPLLGLYLSLGLAGLAKGAPLAAVWGVLPMAVYLAWERRRYLPKGRVAGWLLKRAGLAWGVPLAALIAFSWFLLLGGQGRWDVLQLTLVRETLLRAAGQVDHNKGLQAWPFLFYVCDLFANFAPWSLLFVPAGWWAWRERRGMSAPARMTLCAIGVPFIVMGLVASKRSLYALPFYPWLAVWVVLAWDRLFLAPGDRNTQSPRRLWAILLGVVAAATGLLALAWPLSAWLEVSQTPGMTESASSAAAVVASLILAAAAAWVIGELAAGRLQQASLRALLLVAAAGLVFEAFARPAADRWEGKARFYAELGRAADARPLVWLGGSANEAVWHLDRPVRRLLSYGELEEEFFGKPGAVLLVRDAEYQRSLPLRQSVRELRRMEMGDKVFRLVEPDPARPPSPELFRGPPAARDVERD